MAQVFSKQLVLEQRLERVKYDLSHQPDFNMIDAFRFFDKEGMGSITYYELREGLN